MVIGLLSEKPLDELAFDFLLTDGAQLGNMSESRCFELESWLLAVLVFICCWQLTGELAIAKALGVRSVLHALDLRRQVPTQIVNRQVQILGHDGLPAAMRVRLGRQMGGRSESLLFSLMLFVNPFMLDVSNGLLHVLLSKQFAKIFQSFFHVEVLGGQGRLSYREAMFS